MKTGIGGSVPPVFPGIITCNPYTTGALVLA